MQRLKKLLYLLCLSLIVLSVPVIASAAPVEGIPSSSLRFTVPDGLAGAAPQYQPSSGAFQLNIDVENTDWEAVMLSSGTINEIGMTFVINHPANAVSYAMAMGMFENEAEALDWLDYQPHNQCAYSLGRFSARFAAYIPEFSCVSMEAEIYAQQACYIRWFDANNAVLDTRKIIFTPSWSKTGLHQIDPLSTGFASNRLNGDLNGQSGMTWQAEDGALTYTPVNPSGMLSFGVKAPADATAWFSPSFNNGADNPVQILSGVGYAQFNRRDMPTNGDALHRFITLYFKNAAGNVIDKGFVHLYVQKAASADHSATYADPATYPWQKVPDADLLISNPAAAAGYTMTYHDGVLVTDMTGSQVIPTSNPQITISVKAPAGMKSCRINNMSTGYGPMEDWFYDELQDYALYADVLPVVGDAVCLMTQDEAFRQFKVPNTNLIVYLPQSFMADYMQAETMMILWYASENPAEGAAPDLVQYYNRVDNRFCITYVSDVLASEDDVMGRLTQPVAVDSQGRAWRLQVRYYLQSGTNARHYELKLLDADGNFVTLPIGETLTVYLPYSDGLGPNDPVQYTLDHYTMNFYRSENPGAPAESGMVVECTEHGIKFQTTGFSPFVLRWRDAPTPPTQPPQTGDNAQPALWLCAMALGLLGIGMCVAASRKRRRA